MRELLAHVQFRGTIRERSVEPYLRLFGALRLKKRIRGVLWDISSGGGASVPSTDLYLAVKRLDAVKPVVATIGSVGASGGYMAALGARKVYAYPDSGVGSIGVVYPHLAVRGLLGKLGVEVELIHEGRHKDAFQGVRPLSEEEREKVQAVTHQNYQNFVNLVSRERRRPPEEIERLATGEFWSGAEALSLGLVDAVGDREAALEDLSRITGVPTQKAVRVLPHRPFVERLFGGMATSVVEQSSSELLETLQDSLAESLLRRYR